MRLERKTYFLESVVLSKQYLVDGMAVYVCDELIPASELGQYVHALDNAPFTRTEIATPASAAFRHFVSEMPMANLPHLPLHALALAQLRKLTQRNFNAYRAYTNLALSTDALFAHTDCLPDQRDFTALWYLCTAWNENWAGETVFYNQDNEIALSTLPKPGRLVLFDGRIRHAGRPPSRIAEQARYTFAIKFESKS